jgi:His/Glu/Gln/Arg/opine family amino acid ABC transporter permease subunit
MAVATASSAGPPDVRGPTAPVPLSIFGLGIASLALMVLGLFAIQIYHAVTGPAELTEHCLVNGLTDEQTGSLGVCHIVEGFRSSALTVVLVAAIVLGIAALIAGFSVYKRMPTRRQREHAIAGAVLGIQAVVLALLLFWFRTGKVTIFSRSFLNFAVLEGYGDDFLTGVKNTVVLAFGGEIGGIVLGLVFAVLTLSARRVVRAPARAYINFFRGTPLIWQLVTFYFGVNLGLGLKLDAIQVGLIVFALNTGAYAAEVFRAGIQSIERGQIEAARSLGMSYLQAMRYAIVPQAVRRVIPPLMNEFVILIKDTALIVALGQTLGQRDIFSVAQQIYSSTFNATGFMAAAAGYLIVTLPLIRLVNMVERKLRSGLTGIVGQ